MAEIVGPNSKQLTELWEKRESETVNNAISAALAEMLFVLLPLLVIAIVFVARDQSQEIAASAEWSFGSAVLFGQGIVKMIRSVTGAPHLHGERIGLFCAIVLVAGLVPSLTILSLILTTSPATTGLVLAQFCMFIVSAVAFFVCSIIAAMGVHRANYPKPPIQ